MIYTRQSFSEENGFPKPDKQLLQAATEATANVKFVATQSGKTLQRSLKDCLSQESFFFLCGTKTRASPVRDEMLRRQEAWVRVEQVYIQELPVGINIQSSPDFFLNVCQPSMAICMLRQKLWNLAKQEATTGLVQLTTAYFGSCTRMPIISPL